MMQVLFMSIKDTLPNFHSQLPLQGFSAELDDYWTPIQPVLMSEGKIINIAGDHFPNMAHEQDMQGNRYSFLLKRFKSISITLSKKFSFTLDEFLTIPEIRQRAIRKIQRIIQKKMECIWISFLTELQVIGNNIKKKTLVQHLSFCCKCLKLVNKIGELNLGDFIKLVSLVCHATKITEKMQEVWEGKISFDFKNFFNGINSFNTLVDAFHDVGAIGFAFVEVLDKNALIKMAYEAAGLGGNFSPFTSGVIEFWNHFDIGPLAFLRIYLKTKSLCKSSIKWVNCDPATVSPKKLDHIRLKFFTSSLDMLKEIANITVKALALLGIITQVPLYITFIISGIGIITISIKIYNYFYKNDGNDDEDIVLMESMESKENLQSNQQVESGEIEMQTYVSQEA
jgi:hypothetical protein